MGKHLCLESELNLQMWLSLDTYRRCNNPWHPIISCFKGRLIYISNSMWSLIFNNCFTRGYSIGRVLSISKSVKFASNSADCPSLSGSAPYVANHDLCGTLCSNEACSIGLTSSSDSASNPNSAFGANLASASDASSIYSVITTVFNEGRSRTTFSWQTLEGTVDELTQPLEVELVDELVPPQQTDLIKELSAQPPCERHPIEEETDNHRPSIQEEIVSPRPIWSQEPSAVNSSQLPSGVVALEPHGVNGTKMECQLGR
ncbi:hypothetical protein CDL15_Pgr027162 [Punica granatum]|nr:hypothetical protein CDL15_Pgr027162 [Punica granatum]